MAATATPYGMQPDRMIGSDHFSGGGLLWIPQTANSTAAIYQGSAVTINAGECTAVAATPTTTRGTSTPIGVAVAFEAGPPAASAIAAPILKYLPASAITAGYTTVKIGVVVDPRCVFRIQADGAVTAASLGLNAEIQTFSGSTATGMSAHTLKVSTIASTSTLALRIVGFVDSGTSSVGDAFTDCLVVWNQGVHALTNSTGG